MPRILDAINSPIDVKRLSTDSLKQLAEEIRSELIEVLARNGGHLGPNLGVVELTLALHHVFETPNDHFVFDVSHQAYVHKLLTGRGELFASIRQPGGLNGFMLRTESEHDCYGAGHAGTALSSALGMAVARDLAGGNPGEACETRQRNDVAETQRRSRRPRAGRQRGSSPTWNAARPYRIWAMRRKVLVRQPARGEAGCSDSYHEVQRIFEDLLEGLQKLRAGCAVDDAMIARHRDAHHLAHDDLAFAHDWLRRHSADRQNRALRRIDHRRELVDAKHAEIADRECRACVLLGFQSLRARAFRELAHFSRDLAQ